MRSQFELRHAEFDHPRESAILEPKVIFVEPCSSRDNPVKVATHFEEQIAI